MLYNGIVRVVSEQRRFRRAPLSGTARYRYAPGYEGAATVENVGLGGFGLRLGRYLRPGTLMLLSLSDEPLQLKGRVTWCRGARNHEFVAGLRVFHDDPETTQALTQLVAWASLESDGEARLWSSPTPKVVMG